jgi:hypothetical protein
VFRMQVQCKNAVTVTVTWIHPNLTPGVWVYHSYNWWNGTFAKATSTLHT